MFKTKMYRTTRSPFRSGASATELIVATTLLLSLMGLLFPMTVRIERIWRDTRAYRIALNELSNQFDSLSTLPKDELASRIERLEVTSETQAALLGPELSGSLTDDENGTRLRLAITWQRGPNAEPLELIGWIHNTAAQSAANDAAVSPKVDTAKKEDSNDA